MNEPVFEVVSRLGKRVVLTRARYNHVCRRHPKAFSEIDKIEETLASPHIIRKSTYDEAVWRLYCLLEENCY